MDRISWEHDSSVPEGEFLERFPGSATEKESIGLTSTRKGVEIVDLLDASSFPVSMPVDYGGRGLAVGHNPNTCQFLGFAFAYTMPYMQSSLRQGPLEQG